MKEAVGDGVRDLVHVGNRSGPMESRQDDDDVVVLCFALLCFSNPSQLLKLYPTRGWVCKYNFASRGDAPVRTS